MRLTILVALAVFVAAAGAPAAESVSQKGTIESVMLFRGQALVTRLVPVKAPVGAVQLTVTELPDAVA